MLKWILSFIFLVFTNQILFANAFNEKSTFAIHEIEFAKKMSTCNPTEHPLFVYEIDWHCQENSPPYSTENFSPAHYTSSDHLHISRYKGSVTVSAPMVDQWEIFAEAAKRFEHTSTNYRVAGGVQLKW